jgi:cell wall-active antibiotic response 4TMS protein YvqF
VRRSRTVMWALLLIGVGAVLLLQNTGAIAKDVSLVWVILLAVGLWLLFERIVSGGREGSGFVAPLVLVAVAGSFLLEDLGAVKDNDTLLPSIVIAIGLGLMLSAVTGRGPGASEPVSEQVPLEGATSARVRIDHGAGRLTVRSHHGGANLLEGSFGGGVDVDVHRDGARVEAVLSPVRHVGRLGRRLPLDWTVTLSLLVPLELELHSGADTAELDLSDLSVERLDVETGASRTIISLPTSGRPQVRIRGGAADIRVSVPTRVAAQIAVRQGASKVTVDELRFPKVGDRYRSSDFDDAQHRVEIQVDAGAASVQIG